MILEFRIPMPLTVADFQVAQLDMVIKAQEKVTGGGEGVLVIKNEPYYVQWITSIASITQTVTWG